MFSLTSILFMQADFLHLCRLPPPSTLEMLVPANAVGKVIGKGGTNIANIRKVCSSLLSFLPGSFLVNFSELLLYFMRRVQ